MSADVCERTQREKNRKEFTMSSALEMMPPAPEKRSATSSENQKGMRRTPRVHVWVSLPVCAAFEGERVVEDMFRGARMREETNFW